jgi:putative oxidoreductase
MTRTMSTPTLSSTAPADTGLLILRLGVGAAMLQAGLMKAFDFDGTVGFMREGWRMPEFAAAMVTAAEVLGGLGLLVGLLTPFAACAVLAAMLDAWAVNVSGAAFWADPFNVPFLCAIGAAALLFTGAGRLSVDARLLRRAPWPAALAWGLLAVGIAAAVVTWVILNGSNPIHVTAPTG